MTMMRRVWRIPAARVSLVLLALILRPHSRRWRARPA